MRTSPVEALADLVQSAASAEAGQAEAEELAPLFEVMSGGLAADAERLRWPGALFANALRTALQGQWTCCQSSGTSFTTLVFTASFSMKAVAQALANGLSYDATEIGEGGTPSAVLEDLLLSTGARLPQRRSRQGSSCSTTVGSTL